VGYDEKYSVGLEETSFAHRLAGLIFLSQPDDAHVDVGAQGVGTAVRRRDQHAARANEGVVRQRPLPDLRHRYCLLAKECAAAISMLPVPPRGSYASRPRRTCRAYTLTFQKHLQKHLLFQVGW